MKEFNEYQYFSQKVSQTRTTRTKVNGAAGNVTALVVVNTHGQVVAIDEGDCRETLSDTNYGSNKEY